MKSILITLIAIVLPLIAIAQEGTIPLGLKTSELIKDEKKFTNRSFNYQDNNGDIFSARSYKKGFYIEHFDSNLKLISKHDLTPKKSKGFIATMFMHEGQFCYIEGIINRKEKVLQLFKNTSPLNITNFTKELWLSIPFDDISRPNNLYGNPVPINKEYAAFALNFISSKNNTYTAVVINGSFKKDYKLKIHVFDNALKEVYQTSLQRDLTNQDFNLESAKLNENDGSLFFTAISSKKQKGLIKSKKDQENDIELVKITASNEKSMKFNTGNNYINSIYHYVNKDKMFCVGFYSEKNQNKSKGIAYFDINVQDFTLKDSIYSPFSEQFILDKYGKEKDKDICNIEIRNIHINNNNEVIINAEEFDVRSRSNSINNNWTTEYFFNDIISVKLDSNGKLIWARNINKRQVAFKYSEFFSYTSTYYNNKVYLFLNAGGQIKKLSNGKPEFRGLNNLYVITLDEKGTIQYEKVFKNKNLLVPYQVNFGSTNEAGNVILFQGRKRKTKKFLKITIPDEATETSTNH